MITSKATFPWIFYQYHSNFFENGGFRKTIFQRRRKLQFGMVWVHPTIICGRGEGVWKWIKFADIVYEWPLFYWFDQLLRCLLSFKFLCKFTVHGHFCVFNLSSSYSAGARLDSFYARFKDKFYVLFLVY